MYDLATVSLKILGENEFLTLFVEMAQLSKLVQSRLQCKCNLQYLSTRTIDDTTCLNTHHI